MKVTILNQLLFYMWIHCTHNSEKKLQLKPLLIDYYIEFKLCKKKKKLLSNSKRINLKVVKKAYVT